MILPAEAAGWFGQLPTMATPWYFSNEVLGPVLGAVLAAILALFITSQRNARLEGQKNDLQKKYDSTKSALDVSSSELERLRQQHDNIKEKLRESRVIYSYEQPVLLLGPRNVGKTSLVTQWHAPWDSSKFDPTTTHRQCAVPVHDFDFPDMRPHFAEPSILTAAHAHLQLRVHDFPGDVDEQVKIANVARKETQRFLDETKKRLGVVLICMFDAEEAAIGIAKETKRYYNAELFANLPDAVQRQAVRIERIVVVFNKFDLLRKRQPNVSDRQLLALCVNEFYPIIEPFRYICNPERVCETVTVLDRDNLAMSQGATVVLGEAARGLVATMAGAAEAERWAGDTRATKYLAHKFPSSY